jgi:hypothetical protein
MHEESHPCNLKEVSESASEEIARVDFCYHSLQPSRIHSVETSAQTSLKRPDGVSVYRSQLFQESEIVILRLWIPEPNCNGRKVQ